MLWRRIGMEMTTALYIVWSSLVTLILVYQDMKVDKLGTEIAKLKRERELVDGYDEFSK